MNLFKGKFDASVRETLGTQDLTDIATALQFARSGSVLSALFGAVDPLHVKDNLLLSYVPAASQEAVASLFGGRDAV